MTATCELTYWESGIGQSVPSNCSRSGPLRSIKNSVHQPYKTPTINGLKRPRRLLVIAASDYYANSRQVVGPSFIAFSPQLQNKSPLEINICPSQRPTRFRSRSVSIGARPQRHLDTRASSSETNKASHSSAKNFKHRIGAGHWNVSITITGCSYVPNGQRKWPSETGP